MAFSKIDFENIDKRLIQITQQPTEQLDITSDIPPVLDDLPDSNKAYSLYAAILFVDIRKSTYLTENSHAKSMVKIYRAFMRMSVSCVRSCGGVTRQFLGDRIMGVFLDTIDEKGLIIESAVDKAVNCARAIQTTLDFSLNNLLKNNVNGKMISCGIGIDYGKVLLTKVGMYGVEKDEKKENETDCVWVGKCTNRASKYSDLANGGEIFISNAVYKLLDTALKPDNMWTNIAKHKAGVIFTGYLATDFYMDFIDELGEPIKPDEDTNDEDASNIAQAIIELDRVRERLAQKEVELRLLEQRIKQDKVKADTQTKANERDKRNLDNEQSLLYSRVKKSIEVSHCEFEYIRKMGIDFWFKLITQVYEVGKQLGKTNRQITRDIDCYLIGIYDFYKIYDKSYETMIIMAEENGRWICIKNDTLLWAKERNIVWKLRDAIEKRMNDTSKCTDRDDYQKRLDDIKKIVGY